MNKREARIEALKQAAAFLHRDADVIALVDYDAYADWREAWADSERVRTALHDIAHSLDMRACKMERDYPVT